MTQPLEPPPVVQEDDSAFEIMRVWAALGQQHVAIRPDLEGDISDFGFMLAQLAEHGVNLYQERDDLSRKTARSLLFKAFLQEFESPSGGATDKTPTRD